MLSERERERHTHKSYKLDIYRKEEMFIHSTNKIKIETVRASKLKTIQMNKLGKKVL